MARPRKFYLVFSDHGAPTRIAHGLAEYRQLTGKTYGIGMTDRRKAEEYAAWRDYELARGTLLINNRTSSRAKE